ncbi:MAG: endonuclease III [Candidatus Kariarchaeaceae archaeon]|jgi:endonuclease-3
MCEKNRVIKIIKELHLEYPNSKCSLNFQNPYELLVGTILSAQTTDKQVNKILPDLLKKYPNAKAMSQAGIEEIKPYIRSLGLYNNKAKSLVNMSRKLVNDFQGEVPATMDDLVKLPGVGRKTSNVVLGNAFGIPDSGITVDTHVIRLSQRLKLTQYTTADKIEKHLMKIIPVAEWVDITHLMIDHGRAICGRKPKCDECCLIDFCPSKFKFPHYRSK